MPPHSGISTSSYLMSSALRIASLRVLITQVPPVLAAVVHELGRSRHLPRQRRGKLVVVRGLGLEAHQARLERPDGPERVRPRDPVAAREGRVEVLQQRVVHAGVVVDVSGDLTGPLDAEHELFPLVGAVVRGDLDLLALDGGAAKVLDVGNRLVVLGARGDFPLQDDTESIQTSHQLASCSVWTRNLIGACRIKGSGSRMVNVWSNLSVTSR